MNRGPTPTGKPKRDQQTNFMLSKAERKRLLDFADRMGMGISGACRYLISKGLATEDEGE